MVEVERKLRIIWEKISASAEQIEENFFVPLRGCQSIVTELAGPLSLHRAFVIVHKSMPSSTPCTWRAGEELMDCSASAT